MPMSGSGLLRTLGRGDSFFRDFSLSDNFDLSEPGTYEVVVVPDGDGKPSTRRFEVK